MSIKQSLVGYIFNVIITLLRELRDAYTGANKSDIKVPTNTSTKKKWDKWVDKRIKR